MRDFSKAKRIVVKIGTNTLTKDGGVDAGYVRRIAGQISSLLKIGRQVVIVSSGAIGMGAGQLSGYQDTRESGSGYQGSRKPGMGAVAGKIKDIKMRQACAAIGQPLLMAECESRFCGMV